MNFQLRSLLIAALAVTLVGCCSCRSYQKKTRRPLVDTSWQLIQLNGQSIQPVEGKYTITLLSEQNRISGIGDCNRIMGSYTTDQTRALKIGPLGATRMACPAPSQEQAFLAALESATHYDMDGPMLMLLSNGELRAVFQAQPAVK